MLILIITPILIQIVNSQKCLCSNLTYAFDCIQANCQWIEEPIKACQPTHCANLTQSQCTYTKMKTRDNLTLCHWQWEDDFEKGKCSNFTKCENIAFKTEQLARTNCVQPQFLNKQCSHKSGTNCSSIEEVDDEDDEDFQCSKWHDNKEICNIIIEGDRQCFHHEEQCLKIPDILQCHLLPNLFACSQSDECIWNNKLSTSRCERKRCENQDPCKTFVLDNFINFCKEANNTCLPGVPSDLDKDSCSSLTEYYYRWNPTKEKCISCQIEEKGAQIMAIIAILIHIFIS